MDTALRAILVGSPRDEFLVDVRRIMSAHGATCEICPVPVYAELVSVSIVNGKAEVVPDVPLVWRPELGVAEDYDFDAAFLRGEQFAVCWSAAALSTSRVLNRPSFARPAIPPSGLAALDALRLSAFATSQAARSMSAACIPPERLSRSAGLLAAPVDRQDLGTWALLDGSADTADGRPIRERAKRRLAEVCVEFIVAIDRAWRVRTSGGPVPPGLISLGAMTSQDVARCLDLDIASVTIRPADDTSRVDICRVGGYPSVIGVDHFTRRRIAERVATELEAG